MIAFEPLAFKILLDAHCVALRSDQDRAADHLRGVLDDESMLSALRVVRDPRFLELVHRDDSVDAWATFVDHERKRAKSRWQDEVLKKLPGRIREWHAHVVPQVPGGRGSDPAVRALEIVSERLGMRQLGPEEARAVALAAFRAALWRLWGGRP